MAPPRCIIAVKPQTTSSEIEIKFSHKKYAELYINFLDRQKENGSGFSFTADRPKRTVSIQTETTWSYEGNKFVFKDEHEAGHWAHNVGLCQLSKESRTVSIRKEVQPDEFQDLLEIPDDEWEDTWGSAVNARVLPVSMKFIPPINRR
jgi:hypothetical protein